MKFLTGKLDDSWAERFKEVLPPGISIHAFTTVAVKKAIMEAKRGQHIVTEMEVEVLRIRIKYLENLIATTAKKAGLK